MRLERGRGNAIEDLGLVRHLKGYLPRDIANWFVVLLRGAGIVDVDPGPPLRLRLKRTP